MSGKSDQSNVSKKRNAKLAVKQSSKVKNLEKKARTQEPLQEQHLGDSQKHIPMMSMTNKSEIVEDAASTSLSNIQSFGHN